VPRRATTAAAAHKNGYRSLSLCHAEHDPDDVTPLPVLLLDDVRDLVVQVPHQALVGGAVRWELREQVCVADQPTAATRDRTPEQLGYGAHHGDRRQQDLGPVVRVH
jgi:hypothetical protein